MWQRRLQALLHAKIRRSRRDTGIGFASPGTRTFNTVRSVEAARKSILGIDLGTSNSAACVVNTAGDPVIIRSPEGSRTIPSVVSVDAQGKLQVGLTAKQQASINPHSTFFGTKRLIGRKFTDHDVKNDVRNFPFKIVGHENGEAWIEAYGRRYSPSYIASRIIRKLVENAELQLNTSFPKAVIAIPAYFNTLQRQATQDAGQEAGLDVRLVTEPTAAALAYGLHHSGDRVIAVYDLGGGTFDISIVMVRSGVFQVLSTNGDTRLGGEDLDMSLLRLILQKFNGAPNGCLDLTHEAHARLREAAEHVKIALSSSSRAMISLPYISKNQNLKVKIDRHESDTLLDPLIQRTIELSRAAMKDAKVNTSDISDVVLVGAMTRIPKVKAAVKAFFGRNPVSMSPEEDVAKGAAYQGEILREDVQKEMLHRDGQDVVLLDTIPLSVGIETFGGVFTPIIHRNSTIPISKSMTFTTTEDFMTSGVIKVYQGTSELVAENTLLGSFTLDGISPHARKGHPNINITFTVDAESIIRIHAQDLSTRSSEGITIADWRPLSHPETSPKQSKIPEGRGLLNTSPLNMLSSINEGVNAMYIDNDIDR